MITAWDIYWITRLDSVCAAFAIVFLLAGISMAIRSVLRAADEEPVLDKKGKTMLAILFVLLLVGVFIPSTKEYAAMYVIPKLANNKTVQEVFGKDKESAEMLKKTGEWLISLGSK